MGTGCQTIEETKKLMDLTDKRYVYLTFDSAHFAFSGEDPVEALNLFIDRVAHVHLKDIRKQVIEKVRKEKLSFLNAVREGAFTIPGDGCIDFPSIFKILEEHHYEGWMVVEVEQDPAKANPLEYAIRARKYIRENTGL
jgi:inosose dehydratase